MSTVSLPFQVALGDLFAEHLAAVDLLGRLHVLRAFKERTGKDAPLNTITGSIEQTFADTTVLGFKNVPATGAIERISNLNSYTRLAFEGLKQRYKMQAFTVAGISDVGLIERIQQALGEVVSSGGTAEDFKKKVAALTSDAGVSNLADLHLNTVFQTNVQKAYQNGRFEQMRDPAVVIALPYWVYSTAGDGRVRAAHAALQGFTARQDDPVWRRIYPPCGYNCRCTAYAVGPESVNVGEADQPGLTRIPAVAANVPDPGFGGIAA